MLSLDARPGEDQMLKNKTALTPLLGDFTSYKVNGLGPLSSKDAA